MPDGVTTPDRLSLSVPTRTEHMGTVRNFIGSVGVHYGLTHEQIEDLKLAVSEICGDANESPSDGRIMVSIVRRDPSLDVEVTGIGRRPTVEPGADMDEAHAFRRRLIDALIPDPTFAQTGDGLSVRFTVGAVPA